MARLREADIRTLGERDLENYLLDDEIIAKYCELLELDNKTDDILKKKASLLAESAALGKAPDDVKAMSGRFYDYLKPVLALRNAGNSTSAFLRDTMSKLVTSETSCYMALHDSIFRSSDTK